VFISHAYKVIFVHIQRTGGNSIQKVFAEYDPNLIQKLPLDPSQKRFKHCFAFDIQAAVEPEMFKTYRKFCVVRNPFDRMVSWYAMFKHQETIEMVPYAQNPELWTLGLDVLREISKYLQSFEAFLQMPREHKNGLFERFYLNQVDYISHQDQILVDRILRFENLANDFVDFASEIGFAGTLPHTNKAIRETDYRPYYNDVTKEMIAQRFKRDLDYFGYQF
jgi:hypothetical protein